MIPTPTVQPMAATNDTRAAPNSIGFLRLVLAALVVYAHSYWLAGFTKGPGIGDALWSWSRHTLDAGTMAVQCFFVLSGALIAQSWSRSASLVRFLWHRILRLGPGLWVCLIVTAYVFTPLIHFTSAEPGRFTDLDPSPWGYVWRNLVLPRTQICIGHHPVGTPWAGDWNGSLWTLFYEGACYILVAAFGMAGLITRFRRTGIVVLAAAVVGFVAWTLLRGPAPATIGRLFDTPGKRLTYYFFAGMLCALSPSLLSACKRTSLGLPALLLTLCAWRWPSVGCVTVLLLPAVLFWLAEILPFRDFERRVGGDYSYGVYVYGYPVQQLLAHFGAHKLGLPFYLVASLAITVVFATLSYRLIEKPALGLKHWSPPFKRLFQPATVQ